MALLRKTLMLFFVLLLMQGHVNAFTTQGNQIYDSEGNLVNLKGVNWFGFNNQDTMVDGLWGGADSIAFDFATVVYRMQLLGFNAIRLPFSFHDLYNLAPRSYSQTCQIPTQSQIQASVTDPSVPVPVGATIPPMVSPPPRTPGMCDDYFPNDTTLNRFLWVINFFAKNGFYVLIDDHREDQTVLQNTQQWLQYWVNLVTAISQDPVSRDKLMIDILNEPDGFGIRWEASGGKPALKDLYLSVMDAVYPINPGILFFVEGTGQGGINANWGDGFATDPQVISQHGLSDPNPFFQALLQKTYLNQVVISPHVYPPSVTNATQDYAGPGLWNRLSTSFGYLTQSGYCTSSEPCKVFPVAVGEFGSRFATTIDIQSMTDIASYLNDSGGAADGKHQIIPNWFFWAWNANSGDTGGIVDDSWLNIVWQKIEYLTTIALTPWYSSTTPVQTGTLCVSVQPVDGLSASNLQPITAGAYTFNITNFNQAVCETVPVGTYTVTAPQITTAGYQFTAQPQTVTVSEGQTTTVVITYIGTPINNSTNCSVTVQIGTPWQGPAAGTYQNVINLFVTNNDTETVPVPWTIAITNANYQAISGYWNLAIDSVQNGTITGQAQSSWEALQKNQGNTVNVGMIVTSGSSDFTPSSITINGSPCTITITH